MVELRLGLIQMTSTNNVADNISRAVGMIEHAVSKGAQFIATPEMTNIITSNRDELLARTFEEAEDPSLREFQIQARRHSITLLIGSLALKTSNGDFVNRSVLIGADGTVMARYDKIHMFDVTLGDGEQYRESKLYKPGSKAVVAQTPWGGLGMSICYDLRFPHLYRHMARAGAKMLAVPAAFTQVTGAAHWHVLLRARAIETGCFVFAPGQCGHHGAGRRTFGHSVLIDPWGVVLSELGDEPGVLIGKLDLQQVNEVRQRLPSLEHERDFEKAPDKWKDKA